MDMSSVIAPPYRDPFPGTKWDPGPLSLIGLDGRGSPVALPKCQKCGGAGHFERLCPALSGPLPGAWAGPGTPFPDFSEPAAPANQQQQPPNRTQPKPPSHGRGKGRGNRRRPEQPTTATAPQPPAPAGAGAVNLVAQRLTHQPQLVNTLQQGQRVMALHSTAATGPPPAALQHGQYTPAYQPQPPSHHGNQGYDPYVTAPKWKQKGWGRKGKTYVCPEKTRMEKLEGTVDGMVGDILTLRDHVVALRDQMAALSVPPQSAVTYDM